MFLLAKLKHVCESNISCGTIRSHIIVACAATNSADFGMIKKSILFQSQHLLVIAQAGETDGIFVTFNEMGLTTNADRFWGDTLFEKLKISAIGVMTPTPNWYPEQDIICALRAIRSITDGRRVVTYGHSQGGYGALKYSGALNAAAVLSFCPQWSINPDDVRTFDDRFHSNYRPNLRNGLRIEPDDVIKNSYLLFDKHSKPDLWNAEKIQERSGTTAIHCPFSGHETVRLPAEAGRSADLVSLFMTESADYSGPLKKIMRQSREKSSTYHKHTYKYLVNLGKFSKLEKLLPKFAGDLATEVRIMLAVGQLRFGEAQKLITACPRKVLENIGILKCWTICRTNDLMDAELRIAQDIISRSDTDAWTRLHAVNTYIKADLFDEAKGELRLIIDRFGCKVGINHIRSFAQTLGLPEIEARVAQM